MDVGSFLFVILNGVFNPVNAQIGISGMNTDSVFHDDAMTGIGQSAAEQHDKRSLTTSHVQLFTGLLDAANGFVVASDRVDQSGDGTIGFSLHDYSSSSMQEKYA